MSISAVGSKVIMSFSSWVVLACTASAVLAICEVSGPHRPCIAGAQLTNDIILPVTGQQWCPLRSQILTLVECLPSTQDVRAGALRQNYPQSSVAKPGLVDGSWGEVFRREQNRIETYVLVGPTGWNYPVNYLRPESDMR